MPADSDILVQLEELMKHEFFDNPQKKQLDSKKWPYDYKPLWGSRTIRLLRLSPGVGDSKLEGSITHVLLNKTEAYEALSYVWGDSNKPHSLFLNDGILPITESLFVDP